MRMPSRKLFPVLCAVEIVDHQEAALEQKFAQALGLGFGERPGLHLHGIHPGIVVDVVVTASYVQIDDLLGGGP